MDQPAAGGTEYAEYLLIDDLLRLQCPLTPGADDELRREVAADSPHG